MKNTNNCIYINSIENLQKSKLIYHLISNETIELYVVLKLLYVVLKLTCA